MPLAATTREGFGFSEFFVAEGLLLLRPHAGSLAHATHTFSTSLWKVLCRVLQVSRCGHPRSVTVPARSWFESTVAFFTPLLMPGTDDPSMPGGSTDSAVDGS
jgi:hypothetical protein